MYTRHLEVPVYSSFEGSVHAIHYNHVVATLKRTHNDVRLAIPRLRTLDLILQPDAWILVDRSLNDIPVVAWSDFDTASRDNLHQPVSCQVRLFHAHGNIVMERVLEAMELLLGELFDPDPEQMGNPVSYLRPKSNGSE